jgi:hypothetical protein
MRLTLTRQVPADGVVLGDLLIDGVWICFTLEKSSRMIPLGTYPVVITPSTRFGRLLPLVENVEGRSGIRIHAGNTDLDTDGCILVGRGVLVDSLSESRIALTKVQGMIAQALASHEDVRLTIQTVPEGAVA